MSDSAVLPKKTIETLTKESLPGNVRVQGDAKDLIYKCCTEFVNILSSEANDVATKENKNTITGEHILIALQNLEFGSFVAETEKLIDLAGQDQVEKSEIKKRRKKKSGAMSAEMIQAQDDIFEQARLAMIAQQQQQQESK